MTAEDYVIKVLLQLSRNAADTSMQISKAQFLKTYYIMRKHKQIPSIKIETLLRALRKLAEHSPFLRYHPERRGVYILDVLELHHASKLRGIRL